MKTSEEIKEIVRQKYSEIALQDKETNAGSCCGATSSCCGGEEVYNIMSEEYDGMEGYNPDADLGLGCGLPTQYAGIKNGDVVIDLGSGAGNDCFVARSETGETGKVIGIDFTEAMIAKARENAEKLDLHNVEFRLGDIEKMPVTANFADVVISNCVLNLVPDKRAAFKEVFRVLKPDGHFCISDVVLKGELPQGLKQAAEMYAGCVAGALQMDEYLQIVHQSGFENITLKKEKPIQIPEEILKDYLSAQEIADYKKMDLEIISITLWGEKPASGCTPGGGCC